MEPGSKFEIKGPALYFATRGEGEVKGEAYSKYSAIEMNPGETATVEASADTEWMAIHMPWTNPVH